MRAVLLALIDEVPPGGEPGPASQEAGAPMAEAAAGDRRNIAERRV